MRRKGRAANAVFDHAAEVIRLVPIDKSVMHTDVGQATT